MPQGHAIFRGGVYQKHLKYTPENTQNTLKISKNVVFTQFQGATIRVLGAKSQEWRLLGEGCLLEEKQYVLNHLSGTNEIEAGFTSFNCSFSLSFSPCSHLKINHTLNKSGHPSVSDQKLKSFNYCQLFARYTNKVCHERTF